MALILEQGGSGENIMIDKMYSCQSIMCDKKAIVLLVEDEKEVLNVSARILARHGYDVRTAENCSEALIKIRRTVPDLLVLDIMLPDGNGYCICKVFRSMSSNPVIFLSGKSEITDKVKGLEIGADYYLTKPYNPSELLAVADMLMKRHMQMTMKNDKFAPIIKGPLVLDLEKSKALLNGKDVFLTTREFTLLLLLVRNENNVLSAHEIYEMVWGLSAPNDTNTVRFHITNIRKKIQAGEEHDYNIVSVYAKGYMFVSN